MNPVSTSSFQQFHHPSEDSETEAETAPPREPQDNSYEIDFRATPTEENEDHQILSKLGFDLLGQATPRRAYVPDAPQKG